MTIRATAIHSVRFDLQMAAAASSTSHDSFYDDKGFGTRVLHIGQVSEENAVQLTGKLCSTGPPPPAHTRCPRRPPILSLALCAPPSACPRRLPRHPRVSLR
jgi:hypothetical protein